MTYSHNLEHDFIMCLLLDDDDLPRTRMHLFTYTHGISTRANYPAE